MWQSRERSATSNERAALLAQLPKGVTYVLDRGDMEFTLFLEIIKAHASVKWTMNGVYVIMEHEDGIHSFFAALFRTARLHLHLKRDCLTQAGHMPPAAGDLPDLSAEYVQIRTDSTRTITHLAIARFMARVNTKVALFLEDTQAVVKSACSQSSSPIYDRYRPITQ